MSPDNLINIDKEKTSEQYKMPASLLGDTLKLPTMDPTRNVTSLIDSAIIHQNEMREQEQKHRIELDNIRLYYTNQKDIAETKRIDDNRSTDILAVAAANAVSVQQANTLAAQVATSADAQRSSLANALEPIQKDISEIRKTQYEAAGGKIQQTENKLTVGQILAVITLVGFMTFGFISSMAAILGAVIYFKG